MMKYQYEMEKDNMITRLECIDPEKIIPISRSSTSEFNTGTWGNRYPVHQEKLSPCRVACPIKNNIAQALFRAANEDFDGALMAFMEENPLPGVCGRVCYHFCQEDCNRGKWDEEVSIRACERAAADLGKWRPDYLTKDGKDFPIAVVGSGPAGLSAAYHLARMGHPVTLLEAEHELGGMLRWGIPEYRLPGKVLQKDLDRILSLNITVKTGVFMRDEDILEIRKIHKAVFLALGAQRIVGLDIPGMDSENIFYGIRFLQKVRRGEIRDLKGKVLVIGGGNVAIDTALTASRIGASGVEIACLEQSNEMTANQEELKDSKEEGILFHNGWGPKSVISKHGKVTGVDFMGCTSLLDAHGRFSPEYDKSLTLTLDADYVIISIGQVPDLSGLKGMGIDGDEREGLSVNPESLETSVGGIFAGGDMVTFPGNVAAAVAQGKHAALSIHRSVMGEVLAKTGKKGGRLEGDLFSVKNHFHPRENWDPKTVVQFEDIEPLFLDHKPQVKIPRLGPDKRIGNFDEINLSLTKEDAVRAAERCFFCGTCTGCDRCYIFCPDGSIVRPEAGHSTYKNDSEHCKGCAVCEAVCPRGVMRMVEQI